MFCLSRACWCLPLQCSCGISVLITCSQSPSSWVSGGTRKRSNNCSVLSPSPSLHAIVFYVVKLKVLGTSWSFEFVILHYIACMEMLCFSWAVNLLPSKIQVISFTVCYCLIVAMLTIQIAGFLVPCSCQVFFLCFKSKFADSVYSSISISLIY